MAPSEEQIGQWVVLWAVTLTTVIIAICIIDDLMLGNKLDTREVAIFVGPLGALIGAPVWAWLRVRRRQDREPCYNCGAPADRRMGTRSYCSRHGPRGSHGR